IGAGASGVSQTIDGTGTIYGNGGKGLIRALLAANTLGTVTINTNQNLVAYTALAITGASNFITNDKMECNLAANFDGQLVNRQVYEIVVTNHGSGYTSAPSVTMSSPAGGTAATATANVDLVSGTVRSITVVTGGDGYFNNFNPTITLSGGGFTSAATAVAVVPASVVHGATNLMLVQRGTYSVITGDLDVTSNDGLVSITTSNGITGAPVAVAGQGYSAAPTVGFSGPSGINLVTAIGSGYTGAPTAISVSGATNISGGAYVLADFTYVVQDGKLVSCYLNNQTKTYDVAPNITLTIPSGAGATVAFPAGCWPAATPVVGGPNGMITNFNVTNAGFGYRATPAVGLSGGGFTTAASAYARCGFYALNYSTLTPPGYPTVMYEGPEMPANRMLFQSTFNNFLGTSIYLNGGLTYLGGVPITLTSGKIDLNGGNLILANQGYAGITGGLFNRFVNYGYIEMNLPGTASTTRTVPAGSGIAINNGANTVAFTNGPTITKYRVSTCTPSGATAIGNYSYIVQCFDAEGNAGKYGLNPITTLSWNSNDGLLTDLASLTVSQGTSCAGPWTVRSLGTGTGAIAATGTRATASPAVPGPWVPSGTGTDYFAFTSYFIPVALNYDVTRTTGVAYSSIIGLAGTTHWIGASNDEGTNATLNLTGSTFTYDGFPIGMVTQHANGFIGLTGWTISSSGWINHLAGARRVIAPFWEDLISPMAAPSPANGYGGYHIDGVLGSGTAVITFEWKNMETYQNPGPNLNFQVKLYEGSNNIEFIYGVMQGFDGTISNNGAFAYSYTCGMTNIAVDAMDPLAGQVLAQNEENTRNFSAFGSSIGNRGQNQLTTVPECHSSVLFTPGAYTPYVPDPIAPLNDDPSGAIPIASLLGPPADLCGSYYSSRNATATAIDNPDCDGGPNNADDDVWFQFQCINPTSTLKVYSGSGYNAYVQVFADAAPGALTGVPGAEVQCQNSAGEGATETVNLTGLISGHHYYVRVFHRQGGEQATATATVADGQIINITVTNSGGGYHQAAFGGAAPFGGQYFTPRIWIDGGGGRNAVAQIGETGNSATMANWFTESAPGSVASLTIMNAGSGYASAPTVTIDKPNWGPVGDFAITVYATPVVPANDDICSAIEVTVTDECNHVSGPNSSIATATDPPAGCGGIPDDDVWLEFEATATTQAIEVTGIGSYNAHLEVFSSSNNACDGTLTSLACVNETGSAETEQLLDDIYTPGNTYFVRIYHTGTGGAGGQYTYCIAAPCGTGLCGCMDAGACNYDAAATYDDGSCNYDCVGCMDAVACNYDALATLSGDCEYCTCESALCGCMDETACNYDVVFVDDNGDCDYTCYGCMDTGATNYSAVATMDDGSCFYAGDGETCSEPIELTCASGLVENFTVSIPNDNTISGSTACAGYYSLGGQRWYAFESPYTGMMSIGTLDNYTNYNAFIKVFTGNCGSFQCVGFNLYSADPLYSSLVSFYATEGTTYFIRVGGLGYETGAFGLYLDCGGGCLDEAACNYQPESLFEDGNCFYDNECFGCTDQNAGNYDPMAYVNDGSCLYNGHIVVFNDINANGVMDNDEGGMPNWPVYFPGMAVTIFTNVYGEIEMPLNAGAYMVELTDYNIPPYTITTDDSVIMLVPDNDAVHFGVNIPTIAFDVVTGYQSVLQCTNGSVGSANVYNNGSLPFNCFMSMTCDGLFTPEGTTNGIPPDSTSAGYAEWNFYSAPQQHFYPQMHVDGPGVAYVGQSFTFYYHLILTDLDDNVVHDQQWTVVRVTTCAYDPNDISATPEGYADPHFVLAGERIEYRIRFQNTGNAPAEDILIIDVLDPQVYDLSSFEPAASSNSVLTCLHDDGQIDFIFNDIYLADSVNNEPASHGFVVYEVDYLDGLPMNTVGENFADIIFEQNPPVTTNTVFHTIFDCASLSVLAGEHTVCEGDALLLDETQQYVETYNWSVDGELVSDVGAFILQNVAAGEYNVELEITNPLCTESGDAAVIVNPLPTLNIEPQIEVCEGENITLNAESDSEVIWSNGLETGENYMPAQSETLTASATNEFNCTATVEMEVTVNPLPEITAAEEITVCDGETAILSATSDGEVTWSNGTINGNSYLPVQNETLTATSVSEFDCTAEVSVNIVLNPLPGIAVTQNGAILTAPDGTSWQWYYNGTLMSGETGQTLEATQSGTYYVITTNLFDCTSQSE
ncbi:MAG: hypothetical protein ACKVOR_08185, partial [Flavobacteriales bacterium]